MLSLKDAQALTAAAVTEAETLGQPMNIAVVDAGNQLLSFARMPGAWLGSIDIAQGKAFTARAFDMPTADLAAMAQPGQPLYGIEASNHGRIIVFGGGLPIRQNGEIVGAIGVSGGTVDQDQAVAEAALAGI